MHQNFIPFFLKSQSFLRLSIALYVYITFFFAPIPSLPPFIYHILGIHPSKNIRAVLIFGLEWMRPPWTMVFKYLFEPLPLILSDVHPETKLLAYVLSPCLTFWGTIMPFPQRPLHLMTPSCQQRTWVQILPARPTPVVYFVAVVLLTGCIRSGVSFDLRFLFWLHRLPRGVWAPQQGRHREVPARGRGPQPWSATRLPPLLPPLLTSPLYLLICGRTEPSLLRWLLP